MSEDKPHGTRAWLERVDERLHRLEVRFYLMGGLLTGLGILNLTGVGP